VNDLTPLERKFCAVFWDGPADGIMAYLFRPYPVYTWPVPLWDQANYMLESIAPIAMKCQVCGHRVKPDPLLPIAFAACAFIGLAFGLAIGQL
jgi:hypothetical protein